MSNIRVEVKVTFPNGKEAIESFNYEVEDDKVEKISGDLAADIGMDIGDWMDN